MWLSDSAIEAAGFARMPPEQRITAVFHSLHVFEVRGLTIKSGGVVAHQGCAADVEYTIAIAESVNAACNALTGDDYTDDEPAWLKDHRYTPPFAVLHFGPTAPHEATGAYAMQRGEELHTYDAFTGAKVQIRELASRALPAIEMSLSCAFDTFGNAISFVPITSTIYGTTQDGITVHDTRVSGSATLSVSSPMDASKVEAGLAGAAKLAATIDSRVAQFYQLGSHDTDDLKKFLYYFLAVEIDVHRAFATRTKAQHLNSAVSAQARVSKSLAKVIEDRDNWTNLADRFVWCVASVWTAFTDDDVAEFKELKGVRDGIAHGRILRPSHVDVVAAERLAKRLHTAAAATDSTTSPEP